MGHVGNTIVEQNIIDGRYRISLGAWKNNELNTGADYFIGLMELEYAMSMKLLWDIENEFKIDHNDPHNISLFRYIWIEKFWTSGVDGVYRECRTRAAEFFGDRKMSFDEWFSRYGKKYF